MWGVFFCMRKLKVSIAIGLRMWYIISMDNKLKQIRKRKYLSQEQLANLADVTEQTIVALEHNRQIPKYVTIHKLANALGVKPEDLNFEVQN